MQQVLLVQIASSQKNDDQRCWHLSIRTLTFSMDQHSLKQLHQQEEQFDQQRDPTFCSIYTTFQAPRSTKPLVFMAQSGPLSAEIEALRQLMEEFRAFDGDNDGRISEAEFGGIMDSVGYNLNDQDVRRMMQEWDRNRDGLLSQAEFIEMNTKNMGIADGLGGLLESALEVLEREETVSGEELYEALCNAGLHTQLSMADCIEIIAALDGDEDGAVSFEELQTIVNLFV